MAAIMPEKKTLRRSLQRLRDALAPDVRAAAAITLAERAGERPFQNFLPAPGGTIAGYLPIRSEIDPRVLMARLSGEGFRLALPRITPEGLDFHLWDGKEEPTPGPFSTGEPAAYWPLVTPDLILTPLLAYDREGGRLGYGKGFYDRAFVRFPDAHRVGLAFAMQEVPHVPREAHDVRLHAVFTEA